MAACGDNAVTSSPQPPYASPAQAIPKAIDSRGCEQVKSGNAPNGTATVKVQLIKLGTDLQRVSDDLGGSVQGGNLSVDSGITSHDADEFYTWLQGANLCDPLRSQLLDKAKTLKDAATALASAAAADAPAGLQTAQAAYKGISDLVDNPPAG